MHLILLLIKVGFLEIDFVDLLDIFLVGLLLFQVYRLIKGSLAFNIFLGLLIVYFIWFVVSLLEMQLLKRILEQFVNMGVIALLIVFQPEVRKFLLYLGRGSLARRLILFRKFWKRSDPKDTQFHPVAKSIVAALANLSKNHTAAILVLTETSKLQFYAYWGIDG
jgi:DNA integrity scanning protein DisA with diadenylate cyclase activity